MITLLSLTEQIKGRIIMNTVKRINRRYRKYKRFMKKSENNLFMTQKELKQVNKKVEVLLYLLNERNKEISDLHQLLEKQH